MRRAVTLLNLAALSAGLGACGGGDPGGPAAAREISQIEGEVKANNERVREEYAERQQLAKPSAEEANAKRTASKLYATLSTGPDSEEGTSIDSASFCELMSEDAKREAVRYAEMSSRTEGSWSCEKAAELLIGRGEHLNESDGGRKAEVIGVNAEGDRATATVRLGDGPVTSVPLVKEDGEWKLGS